VCVRLLPSVQSLFFGNACFVYGLVLQLLLAIDYFGRAFFFLVRSRLALSSSPSSDGVGSECFQKKKNILAARFAFPSLGE